MNRTDRLLAIVLQLQARQRVRAEDLAAIFEVSKRTIYRDVLTLNETGVPIVSVPGQGYSMLEGYFLPPLTFTSEEAVLLLLGADFVARNFDDQYRGAAQSASQKIVTVLRPELREEVEYVQRSVQFVALGAPVVLETLQRLRQAIMQHRTVRFGYRTRGQTDSAELVSFRDADPYALIHIGGAWMLIAYCHSRRDQRHFRLSRMEHVTLLDRVFTRPADFKFQLSDDEDRTVIVRALFDLETARRVQEAPSFYEVAQAERADGLLVTFAVRQPDDLLRWLLGWGAQVRVLEPPSLRERLADEAEAMLNHHRSSGKTLLT